MKGSTINQPSRFYDKFFFPRESYFSIAKRDAHLYSFENTFLFLCLILIIGYLGFITQKLSLTRYFDFDEFQVLYAGVALLRGKALYTDQISNHFPLVPIIVSYIIKIFGFTTYAVLAVRYFMLLVLFATLAFIYMIAKMIWNKTAGLFAVLLVMSSLVFVHKGIEIRHDVFNMAFNTMGIYYALKYLKERNYLSLCISGLFLGLAIASTQKAVMWSSGIFIGMSIYLFKENSYRFAVKVLTVYACHIMIPLLLTIGYLLLISEESIKTFLNVTVIGASGYLHPKLANKMYPFPYRKIYILKRLLYENGLFYILGICGLLATANRWYRTRGINERIVIVLGAVTGTLFYLMNSRPFFQNFLPTMPAYGILAAGFCVEQGDRFKGIVQKKNLFIWMLSILLFGWPCYLFAQKQFSSSEILNQIKNISFCLNNLKPEDKVFSFTQQQIFFDPVIHMQKLRCGSSILNLDAICFEEEMIKQNCKIVIFDHRTKVLKKDIKDKIYSNYLPVGVGDIFVPGWSINPKSDIEKEIWIPGTYYSPTMEITIDGTKIKGHLVDLEQKIYHFGNPTSRPVFLYYIFNRKKFSGYHHMTQYKESQRMKDNL